MELKGSKTEKNLMEAFAGESMARNKYTFFASKAKKMHLTNCSDGILQKWGKSCRGRYFYKLKKTHTHT